MSAFSRDLLPNLTPKVAEIELSLGLSLNGRFGVDPTAEKLTRSSSISDSMEPLPSLLLRTCSLPVQKEEELRKRKEIQSLRRLEAKRKRTEKQRKSAKIPNCAPVVVGDSPRQPQALSQQGSVGSQGSDSSGGSESDRLHLQGANKTDAANSREMPSNGHTVSSKQGTYMVRDVLENMPCVSTKGDDPDGKRIEGFLYRYSKGEEVRIVCVCHGSFLSPAEFVRHAGGGDVAHPLRHIVVNHSPLL